MRITIYKQFETIVVDHDKIDSMSIFNSVVGKPSVSATLESGRKIVLCERDTPMECMKEIEDIHNAAVAERAEKRDDVVVNLQFILPKVKEEKVEPENPKAEPTNPGA